MFLGLCAWNICKIHASPHSHFRLYSGTCSTSILCLESADLAIASPSFSVYDPASMPCVASAVSTRWGSGTQQKDITDWVAPQPQRFSFRGANRSERRIDQSWFASHSLVGLPHFKEIYRARFKNGRSDLHCYPGATSETKSNLSWFQVRCQPNPHYAKTH